MRPVPAFRLLAASAILLATVATGCDAVALPGLSSLDPMATPGPANIREELIRTTLEAAGLTDPVEVVEIRQGPFDQLRGLSDEHEAAASVVPGQIERRSLDQRVWKVSLIAVQPSSLKRMSVDAYIDDELRYIVGIVIHELSDADASGG